MATRGVQKAPNLLSADECATAIVRAAQVYGAPPLEAFQSRRRRVRVLAAAALMRAGMARPVNAARALIVQQQELAPNTLQRLAISGSMVGQVVEFLCRAFPGKVDRVAGHDAKQASEPHKHVGDICGYMEGPLPAAAPYIAPSTASGSRVAGKPKPGGVQRTLASDPALLATVQALRARNVPWPHISIQTGKPMLSLRRAFDPTFEEG
jgi:hypothetical protein